uniref:Uncharacterized protein n=1 Tax=Triticum urartu TaxID=4572 RepID=A0A8R7R7K3_TRIUA
MWVCPAVTTAGVAAPVHGDQQEGGHRQDPLEPHAGGHVRTNINKMTDKFSALQLKVTEVNALFTMKQNHSSKDLLGQQGQVHDGAPKHHGEHGNVRLLMERYKLV